jgi:hypothetical protein
MATDVIHRSRTMIDHRGRELNMLRDANHAKLKGDLPAEVVHRVTRAVNRTYFGRWRWRAFALVFLMGGLTQSFITLSPYVVRAIGWQQMGGWMSFIMPAAFVGTLWALIWGAMRIEQRAALQQTSATLLAARHCACCLYPLHGLEQQDDGCTVCPECGGAWRLRDPESKNS